MAAVNCLSVMVLGAQFVNSLCGRFSQVVLFQALTVSLSYCVFYFQYLKEPTHS